MNMNASSRKSHIKWTLWIVLGIVVLLCIAAWFKLASLWQGGFQPPEMAAAQYSSKDVVGNLGGLPVRLPQYAVHLVEYDGEPSWGKSKNPAPCTEATCIKSFGFYARYPDMQMIESYATEKEQKSQSIYTTMWLSVGVTSGEIYPKDGFLDRRFSCLIRSTAPTTCGGDKVYWWDDYERLPKPEHGLTAYALKGIELKSGQLVREQKSTDDVFVTKNKQDQIYF